MNWKFKLILEPSGPLIVCVQVVDGRYAYGNSGDWIEPEKSVNVFGPQSTLYPTVMSILYVNVQVADVVLCNLLYGIMINLSIKRAFCIRKYLTPDSISKETNLHILCYIIGSLFLSFPIQCKNQHRKIVFFPSYSSCRSLNMQSIQYNQMDRRWLENYRSSVHGGTRAFIFVLNKFVRSLFIPWHSYSVLIFVTSSLDKFSLWPIESPPAFNAMMVALPLILNAVAL